MTVPMRRCRSQQRHRHCAGFTLYGALAATAVLAVATLAVSHAVLAGHTHARHAEQEILASNLAEDLIEEVLQLPYADPDAPPGTEGLGPEPGENRRDRFDNVDDYHGFSEAAGSLTNANGEAYPDRYQPLARTVTAQYQSLQLTGGGTPVQGVTVTVTVSDSGGELATLTRFVPAPTADPGP